MGCFLSVSCGIKRLRRKPTQSSTRRGGVGPPAEVVPPPTKPRQRVCGPEERAAVHAVADMEDATNRRSLIAPLLGLLDVIGMRVSEAVGLGGDETAQWSAPMTAS